MTVTPSSPYKGLNAFDDSELDALLFFGREREREIVVANLIASRLTVLYGPSGVGKSSLLSAAVARSLRELPEKPLVVVFSRWGENPAEALAAAVVEGGGGGGANGTAVEALTRAQAERDVYLVLDQIEEYFLYHSDDAGTDSFAETLPAVLAAPYRINVLVSLREDSLAELDRFTGRITGLFANTLRLDRLDRQAARSAIVRPVERFAELTGEAVEVEPELVDQVLDEVSAGRIDSGLGGLGTVEGVDDAARIEAPYLQLVMQRLWDEEQVSGSDTLRLETFIRLGGARQIVEEHLEGAVAELTPEQQDVAARLFNHLVTPSGTKIAHEASDLADFGHVGVAEVAPVLAVLAERRILRSFEEGGTLRYEIFHDVLAQPVLAWRNRHRTEREIERQLAAAHERRRRLQVLVGLVLVALVLMGVVTVFALSQRSDARTQARQARAHELEALATTQLSSDPELSLLLSLAAVRLAPTVTAEETLRTALFQSRVRRVIHIGKPVEDATIRRGRVLAVTADGDLISADALTGAVSRTVHTGEPVEHVSFAQDGTAAITGRDHRLRLVRPTGRVREVPRVDGTGATLSPDGTQALVLRADGVHLVDVATGREIRVFAHRGALSAAFSPHGDLVVTGGADGTVRLWKEATGRFVRNLPGQDGHAVAVAFSPRGGLVASASSDGLARVWDAATGTPLTVLSGHGNNLTDVGFSTDGTQVVTASRDRTARVWKARTGDQLVILAGHTDQVNSAALTGAAGSPVVTASVDGTVRVWDALVQPVLRPIATFGAPVTNVDYPRLGQVYAVSGGRVVVLDPATGKRIHPSTPAAVAVRPPLRVVGPSGVVATIRGKTVILRDHGRTRILGDHRDLVTSASFSSDGALLVTASRDHDVRIWDVSTGRLLHVLEGHFNAVNDARFSPDGRWVISAGPSTAGLWDAHSGTLVTYLRGHLGRVLAAGFDPTSKIVVTGGDDGTVRIWGCDICGRLPALVTLADRRLARSGRMLTDAERQRFGLG